MPTDEELMIARSVVTTLQQEADPEVYGQIKVKK
jgi:hypothetical protein